MLEWEHFNNNLVSVLYAVKDQCGPTGKTAKAITVENVTGSEISLYVDILTQLDFIQSIKIADRANGDIYYPIRLLHKGNKFLTEFDKTILSSAGDAFKDFFKSWTGVDPKPFVDFFTATYFMRDRPK